MSYEISQRVKTFISLIEDYEHTVDGGAVLSGQGADINTDESAQPADVALTVSWVDGEGLLFEESFTFEAIDAARSDGDQVILKNTDGENASFRFFKLTPVLILEGSFEQMKTPSPFK